MSAQTKGDGDFGRRRVLITGGAGGIGGATAGLLAERGARVAILDIKRDRLESTAAETGALPIYVDLRSAADTIAAVEQAAADMDGLDGVVNAAGVSSADRLGELTLEDWNDMMAVNLTAAYVVLRAALPHIKAAGGGSVVSIASTSAIDPSGGACSYSATKAGIMGLTRALAAELAPDQIRVNSICPGFTLTPMTIPVIERMDNQGVSIADTFAEMKRIADPREMAQAIAFLLGNEASYVTGSSLVVDGGRCYY